MISYGKMVYFTLLILTFITGCNDTEGKTGNADTGDSADDTDRDSNTGTDSNSDGDSDADTDVEFLVNLTMSPEIPTVSIIKWSINKGPLTSAAIEFGREGNVEYTAPVDLNETEYRTLLLGMKPSTTYTFHIVANDKNGTYKSDDYTLKTGAMPISLPSSSVTGNQTDLAGGFIITCSFTSGWAFIMDKDGDYVWWYQPDGGIDGVRARMSYDGKYMVNANGNVPGPNDGTMSIVSMDGLDEQTFDVPQRHHDVEVLPDGSMVYMEYETSGIGTCDRVMEMSPDGDTNQIFLVRDYFSDHATNEEWCHSNAINYIPEEDAFTFSILDLDTIIKFKRSGELVWALGGEDTDFPGISWDAQHQHQWLGDSILIFNNNGDVYDGGFFTASRVIEYSVNESSLQASLIWEYSSGNLISMSMGDAKRLSNGNTLVVYSTSGMIHEVSPSKETLREISFGSSTIGYVEWRETLYGPPQIYR